MLKHLVSETTLLTVTVFRSTMAMTCALLVVLVSLLSLCSQALGDPIPLGNDTLLDKVGADFSLQAAAAAPPTGSFEFAPIGTPLGTGELKLEVTIVVNGQRVTKPVTIKQGDIRAFVITDDLKALKKEKGELTRAYQQALLNAKGEASQAKAKVIADAINEAFKDEFAKLGDKAGVGLKIVSAMTSAGRLEAPFGAVIIPGVSREQGSPIKILEGRILGEGGNGGRFIPGAGPSPGSRGSLERSVPDVTTVATGFDPFDEPSIVEIGVGENVARFTPTVGMTDADVLSALRLLLDRQGLPATFDQDRVELFLDTPVLDGQTFVWGNTDTGLEFLASMEGLQVAAVPEPSTLMLLSMGVLCLCLYVWRQRKQAACDDLMVLTDTGGNIRASEVQKWEL